MSVGRDTNAGLPRIGDSAAWETSGFERERAALEAGAGLFDMGHWGVVEIEGADARDFLQRLTTVHFKNFPERHARWGAFLNGRSGVITLGIFDSFGPGFRYWLPPPQKARALEHIEQFHFAEKMTVRDAGAAWHLVAVWHAEKANLPDVPDAYGWNDASLPGISWRAIPGTQWDAFRAATVAAGLPWLGERLFEALRIRAGKGRLGIDFEERDLILTCGWDEAVDRNKGCYPGQETVERIFTYGQVNKKLVPVTIELPAGAAGLPEPPFDFFTNEELAGRVVSYVSWGDKISGLAFLGRTHWDTASFSGPNGARIIKI